MRSRPQVRSLSTRARITATSFVNEYHWGDFRGDPNRMMERYYDAHLHVTNWGTHRVMFRLPSDLLDPEVVEEYCAGDHLGAWVADESVVLDLTSQDHAGEFEFDDDAEALLSAIVGVRAELAAGDLRPLYVAWLAAYGAWEREEDVFDRDADDDLEPPVPPGLARSPRHSGRWPTSSASTTTCSRSLPKPAHRSSEVADDPGAVPPGWTGLPIAEKDRLLQRVVQGEAARVRMEMLRRFRGEAPRHPRPSPPHRRRPTRRRRTPASRPRASARRSTRRRRGTPGAGASPGPRTTTRRTGPPRKMQRGRASTP